MSNEDRNALLSVRLEHARNCLASSVLLLSSGDYKGAANRSYYAIFHAMRAVLSLDEIDMKRHSGIISEFRKRYIKTGKIDAEMSNIISGLFDSRTSSDYDDFFILSKEEIREQVENAKIFLQTVERFISESIIP